VSALGSRLRPDQASMRPASVRHLLTHTAGVGYWRRLSDLLQPGVGSGDRAARSGALPLADYYRGSLPVEVEPGTKWVYSNHGFAALGLASFRPGSPTSRAGRPRYPQVTVPDNGCNSTGAGREPSMA
jgi:CubicO group peptidase (beta-lactamase class C family)